MKINIAIDGTSGVGKSFLGDALANKLGYIHLDTGAMYRAVAYKCLKNNISLDDEEKIASMIKESNLDMSKNGKVILDNEDITDKIRTEEISMAASTVSKLFKVRQELVALQQKICKDGGYILDGRDIGTVVLKDAPVKLFLTASAEVRANRRLLQYKLDGKESNYKEIYDQIIKRDYQDSNRANSPLKKASDSVEIDTSNLNKEEVLNRALDIINSKLGK